MSRRFKKAYRFARACAEGRPPFPKERIFLCNWYVKLVKPGKEIPNNQVQCHVPMKMTKFDIKNYFEKIYKIDVAKVNTRIQLGKTKTIQPVGIKKKRPDYKVAYLTLENQTFKFPDLFANYHDYRDRVISGEDVKVPET